MLIYELRAPDATRARCHHDTNETAPPFAYAPAQCAFIARGRCKQRRARGVLIFRMRRFETPLRHHTRCVDAAPFDMALFFRYYAFDYVAIERYHDAAICHADACLMAPLCHAVSYACHLIFAMSTAAADAFAAAAYDADAAMFQMPPLRYYVDAAMSTA